MPANAFLFATALVASKRQKKNKKHVGQDERSTVLKRSLCFDICFKYIY